MIYLIPLLTAMLLTLLLLKLSGIFKDKTEFFSAGRKCGFTLREMTTLWRLAYNCGLADPEVLFDSLPDLNHCITLFIDWSKKNGSYESYATQHFLEKLYSFRSKVSLEYEKKLGIKTSREISIGQKLRILVTGSGIFNSKVIDNSRELVISLPVQSGSVLKMTSSMKRAWWEGKKIAVYFWRKNDAAYVFDSMVFRSASRNGESSLFLQHSENLERTQKRKSIRSACELPAMLYFTGPAAQYQVAGDDEEGFRCLIENISENGAMIRIGGKCRRDLFLKLQFDMDGDFILMQGKVKSVEYNKYLNQSRIHFECTKISSQMKKMILAYTYRIDSAGEEQKKIMELMDQDSEEDSDGEVLPENENSGIST
ncbi:PilZ domain-containing protein [Treponema sp.]|uniref:PilZ domain-containing protein n=1 Tax=Treponema sp. TaxID=166 RepID=UPI0025DE432C|nr:PilZ domain-containing protein [Treponema sp.]MCR5218435.1 PilZ domain-containing protein [Treponema sp.]